MSRRKFVPRAVSPTELEYVRTRLQGAYRDLPDSEVTRILSFMSRDVSLGDDECNYCNAAPRYPIFVPGGDHRIIRFGGKTRLAHRLFFEMLIGPIPAGLCVLHSCHQSNGRCINTRHLRLGTKKENTRDMIEAGNSTVGLPGESNKRAKLTEGNVREIRQLAKDGMPREHIGHLFGISGHAAGRVVNRITWANVK